MTTVVRKHLTLELHKQVVRKVTLYHRPSAPAEIGAVAAEGRRFVAFCYRMIEMQQQERHRPHSVPHCLIRWCNCRRGM